MIVSRYDSTPRVPGGGGGGGEVAVFLARV